MALKIKARKVSQGKKGKKKTWLSVEGKDRAATLIDQIAENIYRQRDLIDAIENVELHPYELSDYISESPEYAPALFYTLLYTGGTLSRAQLELLDDAVVGRDRRIMRGALDYARKYKEELLAKDYMVTHATNWRREAGEELADSLKAYNEAKRRFRL